MVDQDRLIALRQAVEDLYFAYRTFTDLPDQLLGELGLGRTHHRILYFVQRDPGLSVGELLAVLNVSKQAIHRPIKDLEERGLLSITADADDRRLRRLSATPEGADLEARLTSVQMRLLDHAFEGIDTSAVEDWHRIMQRLAQPPAQ
ncbi:MarR family winged helix-turn-helix transcriptional regulator [Gordonia caeni]|uniref:MarR family winged helix-turn-helix transcriptional regulator n=1 Tax=Gordonia caeni TaxID=1007097 RepID=A0ABP7NYN9_9ACTN